MLSKPVIAAVSGYALGGGCEIAMSCDMIVASETAVFGQPEINLGILPGGGGTQRLTRSVGKALAMEIMLTDRRLSAEEALRYGLVNRVAPLDEYMDVAIDIARKVASKSQVAVRLTKEAINKAYETSLETGLAYERRNFLLAFGAEDKSEGMRAFIEKTTADMAKPLSLTLLYTANIRGDLALLPRLYTFLQQLKGTERRSTLLLDLGTSCAESVWHCRATGGRSTLIALDGMGYQAANVEGILGCDDRDALAQQVTLGLVDRAQDWIWQAPGGNLGIRATLKPNVQPARLQIMLKPADNTRLEGRVPASTRGGDRAGRRSPRRVGYGCANRPRRPGMICRPGRRPTRALPGRLNSSKAKRAIIREGGQ